MNPEQCIDLLFIDLAAVDSAAALLMVEAYLLQLGPNNAPGGCEKGKVIHTAVVAAEMLQTYVADFEWRSMGWNGWEFVERAIADKFGAEWAKTVLGWVVHLERIGPIGRGASTLARWVLSQPVMGSLLPDLDALLLAWQRAGDGGSFTDMYDAAEAVRADVLTAIDHGASPTRLQGALDLWSSSTGGPTMALQRVE